jgi:hypothetical protein
MQTFFFFFFFFYGSEPNKKFIGQLDYFLFMVQGRSKICFVSNTNPKSIFSKKEKKNCKAGGDHGIPRSYY